MDNIRSGFLKLIAVSFLLLTCSLCSSGQSANPSDQDRILVKSWKTGNSRILEQSLNLRLEEELDEYEFDIYDTTKLRHFRLRLRRYFERTIRKPSIPCWSVVFKEITKDAKTGGNIIGWDMLSREGPGVGHYFPREAWAGALCPIENPQGLMDNQLYPIKAERQFLIERFLIVLKVMDYKLDEKENRLPLLDLKVEFKNQN